MRDGDRAAGAWGAEAPGGPGERDAFAAPDGPAAPDDAAPRPDCRCGREGARKKPRDAGERRELMNRLRRIEGQVRGLQRMLEEDTYCPEILTQASAVSSALNSFCRALLENHLKTCVTEDIRAGREDAMDELLVTLQKLMK